LTTLFWLMVVLTGVATGLFGDLLMFVHFSMQHLAFNYHSGFLQAAAERASELRRVGSLLLAGLLGGVSWYIPWRYTKGESSEIDDEIWNGEDRLSFRRSPGTPLISEVVIGMGVSIGREAAPKLMGGASGSVLASWARLVALQCGDERLLSSRALSSRGKRARSPRSYPHRGSDVMTTSVVRDLVKTERVESIR
jgi:H+/Cl- antiporter ClcA